MATHTFANHLLTFAHDYDENDTYCNGKVWKSTIAGGYYYDTPSCSDLNRHRADNAAKNFAEKLGGMSAAEMKNFIVGVYADEKDGFSWGQEGVTVNWLEVSRMFRENGMTSEAKEVALW